ncbi:MAG: T9SS type A sorting domain-containing protein [Bacteroidetes bacterium]|nr:T9SS type A sorting domain-containing protein [Bacteroidota bacterium]
MFFTKSITGQQQLIINCENWTPGIYLYQLITKEGNQTGKIIVE